MIPEITTKGPGAKLRKRENKIPEKALVAPNMELRIAYLERSALRFFAAAAGTMTRNPTRSVPTIWIPMATTIDTSRR
jgi:hypothetical protein